MQNESKFLTITQAAAFLKVSPDTLRRWEEKGIVSPVRTKGGIRKYTLLDLKIAKLKRKIRNLSDLSDLSDLRDLKVAFFTSFLWIIGIFSYQLLAPLLKLPANEDQRILSDQINQKTRLKIASEITQIKASAMNILIAQKPDESPLKQTSEVNPESDLLILRNSDTPTLQYTDNTDKYYSLKPLPKTQ